ncbi:hypothetical protein [Methylobacterium trifolii]|uniref:Uncharacterized protein n=1 Tax=Methylobacterium trifolii TaxID=1003092 RepID=A0ABQ4U162_9HYPH|nr:hypothetical protein [Methylobacterium trifolii]GJE60723.1 hypothetical protein MPOCJGCO_2838 [Methylobacterium trifolii]
MNASLERVRDVLAELIKAALVSDDRKSLGFRDAARAGLAGLAADPPDAGTVRMDGAWTLAIQAAEAPEFRPDEGQVNLTLPRQSPLSLSDLLDPGLDVDRTVDRIRKSASTG